MRTWLWVDDGTDTCPDWADSYEAAATSGASRVAPEWGRTGDDYNFLYTGGTTGMPKGVMWRQDDLVVTLSASLGRPIPEDGTLDDLRGTFTEPGSRFLPALPADARHRQLPVPVGAAPPVGSIVTLDNRTFDPAVLLDTIEREGVNSMAMVGDAFGKPILRTLDENPGRWDLSSLLAIVSSGVMWSKETKEGLLRHHPGMLLMDALLVVGGTRDGQFDLRRRRARPTPPSSSSARTRS